MFYVHTDHKFATIRTFRHISSIYIYVPHIPLSVGPDIQTTITGTFSMDITYIYKYSQMEDNKKYSMVIVEFFFTNSSSSFQRAATVAKNFVSMFRWVSKTSSRSRSNPEPEFVNV
jgi:hypothetical protein